MARKPPENMIFFYLCLDNNPINIQQKNLTTSEGSEYICGYC